MLIVKDLAAWDGFEERLVGSKLTRVPEVMARNGAEWQAAWYIRENDKWVLPGTKQWKTAKVDLFDIRQCYIEDAEYGLVGDTDADYELWQSLPLPGQRNGLGF